MPRPRWLPTTKPWLTHAETRTERIGPEESARRLLAAARRLELHRGDLESMIAESGRLVRSNQAHQPWVRAEVAQRVNLNGRKGRRCSSSGG